jgi:hypothetical protein
MKDFDNQHDRDVANTAPQRMKTRSLLSELIESQHKAKLEQSCKTSDQLQTLHQGLATSQNDQIDIKVRFDPLVLHSVLKNDIQSTAVSTNYILKLGTL